MRAIKARLGPRQLARYLALFETFMAPAGIAPASIPKPIHALA